MTAPQYETVEHEDSFFMSLRPLFVLGKSAGVLPLVGTTGNSYKCLKHKWTISQFVFTSILLCTTLFIDIIFTVNNFHEGIRYDNFGPTLFYSSCVINTILFVAIARRLPNTCFKVASVERQLGPKYYPKWNAWKIRLLLGSLLLLSTVEHSLVNYLSLRGAIAASEENNQTLLENFFGLRFNAVADSINFTNGGAIFILSTNVFCTLNWNYLDFFIMCICLQLSAKFKMINHRMKKVCSQEQTPAFWYEMWQGYNSLSNLTKEIEHLISNLVFASFVNNLYYLSLQLLRSIRIEGDVYAMSYFYFSLLYLALRALLVAFCASSVSEESKVPKHHLFSIEDPCFECRRLLDQVLLDDIKITGNNFFTVNRQFILTVTATLMTYELVLLQLNSLKDYT